VSGAVDVEGVMSQSPDGLAAVFSDRFTRCLSNAEQAIAERSSAVAERQDPASSSAYQEIILLKVRLELESARILASAAKLGTELVQTADGLRRGTGEAGR
jgi:hypothetical protein